MPTPVKIVDSHKADNQLISVTVQLTDPAEIEIYRKFLKDEPAVKKCPECGAANEIGDDDLRLRIDSPLVPGFLNAATPIMHCDFCDKDIYLNMVEYTCFPSVVQFINQLRTRYAQLKKGKK